MSSTIFFLILVLLLVALLTPVSADFFRDFQVTWSPSKVKILNGGEQLQLVLDSSSGSGFKSKEEYLFGNVDMQIKLVPGDSAGTVTAYYLSSQSTYHDELDFEFLGNVSGEPYILQTNVFASGVGGREQRIFLWFDPTTDFHTYSISWTKQQILFLVDGTPIRAFPNEESLGSPYLDKQAMGVYSSIWNGDQWATRGGLVKIDWAHAPFVASYRNFQANACVVASGGAAACIAAGSPAPPVALDAAKLAWVERNYMVYNYCTDRARYPTPPVECRA